MRFGVPTVRWSVRPPAPPRAVAALSRALQVPPALAAVLWSRGLRDATPDHLNPKLTLSPNPTLPLAAERLARAVRAGERILIHGDYDADGISGTATLLLGLRELGAVVTAFIPDRLTDGYGIHPDRVPEHADRADLFLTVDCGVTNLAEIARLQAAGVEVIVTDHHTPGTALPDCLVVHPGLSPAAGHGLPELTGAGVAFHLLWAVRDLLGLEPPLEYADLATLGTIADVAPLLGENRALIKEGLARMADSRWPGIRASVALAKLSEPVSAREVAFVLAPRLNAAGRLGEADAGLELLTTASERRAAELATYLDVRNGERRRIQDAMFEEALGKADPEAPALVLEDPSWHPGVMGIVASKLLERYYLPVYIAAAGKGSVRSTPGISAVAGLRAASAHLLRYGGHRQAAGFALDMANFGAFQTAIYDYARGFPRPVPEVVTDAILCGEEIEGGLWRSVQELEPFGEGHPAPLFALSDGLEAARAVGQDGNTLQLRIGGVRGVGWRMGDLAESLPVGGLVNAAVTLEESEFRDKRTLEFRATAVRAAAPLPLAVGEDDQPDTPAQAPGVRRLPVNGVHATGPDVLTDVGPDPVAALEGAARASDEVRMALTPDALHTLERTAKEYPTVAELRRGLSALMRGAPLPFLEPKAGRIKTALDELGLLDDQGRAVRLAPGTRVSPYESPSLMDGLVRRYRLRTFVHAYRHLDDDGFAFTLARLFGPEAAPTPDIYLPDVEQPVESTGSR
jgi:single-stranded-DNA-specific exonuclease